MVLKQTEKNNGLCVIIQDKKIDGQDKRLLSQQESSL